MVLAAASVGNCSQLRVFGVDVVAVAAAAAVDVVFVAASVFFVMQT